MKQYNKYKDSGVKWIGEIPSHWKAYRLKALYSTGKGLSITKADLVADGYPVISYGQIHSKLNKYVYVVPDLLRYVPNEYLDNNKACLVGAGDFIFADTSEDIDGCGNFIYIDSNNKIFAGYHSVTLKSKANSKIKYLAYLFQTDCWRSQIRNQVSGIKVFSISQKILSSTSVILPSLPEQRTITTYLDTKCADIDSLISLQEEMISELQAYKQSVITEAVTHGLNPNVTMKDSGVEWIGNIPEEWEVLPIRSLFQKRMEKNNPVKTRERLSLSIDLGVTRYEDKTTNLDRFKDDFTQYQIAYPNDIVLNSMNMIVGAVGKSDYMGCVSPVYYVITVIENNSANYYAYLLNSVKIREVYHCLGRGIYAIERGEGRVNTCRLKVPYYDFSIIDIPVPTPMEQRAIAAYLKTKCAEIDTLITIKQQKIDELKEYKKSIIFEYVTGKKIVPTNIENN